MIFLVKNDLLLLLNGIVITALVQSSSAVSSVIIILASNALIDFSSAIFLILGANIGTCLPVILASLNKSEEALKTAFFNLCFNLIGVLLVFMPLSIFKEQVSMDEAALRKISEVTGGSYYNVRDKKALENALAAIDELEKTEVEQQIYLRYNEYFAFFLILGFVLCFLACLFPAQLHRGVV
jgi:hypothetical protein